MTSSSSGEYRNKNNLIFIEWLNLMLGNGLVFAAIVCWFVQKKHTDTIPLLLAAIWFAILWLGQHIERTIRETRAS